MKILFFMPDCPIGNRGGNLTRTLQMLRFLHDTTDRNEVDFLSLGECAGREWTPQAQVAFRENFPHIGLMITKTESPTKKRPSFRDRIFRRTEKNNRKPSVRAAFSIDPSDGYTRMQLEEATNAKRYDMIISSYASWSIAITDGLSYRPYLILDTHDFITAQRRHEVNEIGRIFQSEMDILRKFDEIWTFSIEEKYVFEQFTNAKVVHIPVSFSQKPLAQQKDAHKYDVVYVASDNPHNVRSVKWLLDEVEPWFRGGFRIHVFGPICKVLRENGNKRFVLHGIVDDLQEVYDSARITICPMLSGTGVKIKVLESLSNNLPVVTNTRGVDGLAQKKNNGCLVADGAAAFAEYVEKLLTDDPFYEKTRREAHDFIAGYHDVAWERTFFRNKFLGEKPD